MVQVPVFNASGDINRSRFVAPSGVRTVAQATVGSVPIGISQRGTRDTPLPGTSTLAAIADSVVSIYGMGEFCSLEAGAAVAVNSYIKPDSVGRGVAIEGGEPYYAFALSPAGAAGEMFDVWIMRGTLPMPTVTAAAAGSTQSDATLLAANTRSSVSAADGTKGVKLPVGVAGMRVHVYNEHATNGLKIYPNTGGDINDGTTNAAITMEGKTLAIFECLDGTTWAATFTVNT